MPVMTKCSYCGKTISISPRDNEKLKNHFCNKKCYLSYRQICPNYPGAKYTKALTKIKNFAKIRNDLIQNI